MKKINKIISLLLCFVLIAAPLPAQVLPDGTTVTAVLKSAQNNTPVINIAAPSASGVSHNRYKEYNVGPDNLIINNSKKNGVLTKLGGYVLGNPYLMQAGREAQIILNEISGVMPTALNGYSEIAGQKAQLIIANPNGITASGAGFINTAKLTLVTGRSNIINGELQSFSLDNSGKITVNAQNSSVHSALGIDAQDADSLNLVSRFMEVNGNIFAKDLNLLTGSDRYYYADNRITSKPAANVIGGEFAIDAGLLGAMRAGTINIIATERGFGVNTQGDLMADLSGITISSQGDIKVKNAKAESDINLTAAAQADIAEAYSKADINLSAGSLAEYDTLKAAADINIQAQSVRNKDMAQAGKNINIDSQSFTIDVPQSAQSGIISYGDINLNTAALDNLGEIAAYNNITINAQSINNAGRILAQDNLEANAVAHLDNSGSIYGGAALGINSDGIITNTGSIYGNGDILIKGLTGARAAAFINNAGLVQAQNGKITLNAQDIKNLSIDNCDPSKQICYTTYWVPTGIQPSMGSVVLHSYEVASPTLAAVGQGRILARDIELNSGDILNNSSIISAQQNILINADNLTNTRTSFEVTLLNYMWKHYKVKVGMRSKYSVRNDYWYQPFQSLVRSLTPAVIKGAAVTINATGSVLVDAAQEGQNDIAWSNSPNNGLLEQAQQSGVFDPITLTDFGAGGMFKKDDVNSSYLFVTNNRFLSAQDFVGADYFAALMGISNGQKHANGDGRFDYNGAAYNIAGLDSDKNAVKWLGDAVYEQQLIAASILKLTGNTYLFSDAPDMNTQMTRLYDNALSAYQNYGLEFGKALSDTQIAALKDPIIWYVEKEYEGQTVYGPVLYLPKGYIDGYADSPYSRIEGDKLIVNIKELKNSGLIAGTQTLIAAQENISNLSGTITAKNSLDISAGGDIENTTKLNTVEMGEKGSDFYYKDSWLGDSGQITSGGNLKIKADGDITSKAGIISAQQDAALSAKNINILTQVLENESAAKSKYVSYEESSKTNIGSFVGAGGNLEMTAAETLLVSGSGLNAQGDIGLSGGRVDILSVEDTYHMQQQSRGGNAATGKKSKTKAVDSIKQVGSEVAASGKLTITSASDVNLLASVLGGDKGGIEINAANDINILAGQDFYATLDKQEKSRFYGLESSKDMTYDSITTQSKSVVFSGENLKLSSGGGTTVYASDVGAKGDGNITTGGNFNLLAGVDSTYHYEEHWERSLNLEGMVKDLFKTALLAGVPDVDKLKNAANTGRYEILDVSLYNETTDITETYNETARASSLNIGGKLNIDAGSDVNIKGSEVNATDSIDITAENINITAQELKSTVRKEHEEKDVSLTAGASNAYVNTGLAVKAVADATEDLHHAEQKYQEIKKMFDEGRASQQALDDAKENIVMASANLAMETAAAGFAIAGAAGSGLSTFGTGVQFDAGLSAEINKSSFDSTQISNQGSLLLSGGNISLNARKDINQVGSSVLSGELGESGLTGGGDINYTAGGNVTIEAAANTYKERTSSSNENINMGVNSGGSLSIGYGQSNSKGSASDLWWSNSQTVTGDGAIKISSGADTTVKGANIQGADVSLDVGGKLLVASLQDEHHSNNSSNGFNGGISFSGGGSGQIAGSDLTKTTTNAYGISGGYNQSRGESDSAWVNNQTTIVGTNSVDITADTTHIKGAVIANIMQEGIDGGNLTLKTNKLTYEDIHDYSNSYESGFGLQTNFTIGGNSTYTDGAGNVVPVGNKNGTNAAGNIKDPADSTLHPDGSTTISVVSKGSEKEQETRATVGDGAIIIAGEDATSEELEGLNRDVDKAQEVTRDQITGASDYSVTIDHKIAKKIVEETAKGTLIVAEQIAKGAIKLGEVVSDAVAQLLNKEGVSSGEFADAQAMAFITQRETTNKTAKKVSKELDKEISKENKKAIKEYEKEIGRKLTAKDIEEYYDLGLLQKPVSKMTQKELDNYMNSKITELDSLSSSTDIKSIKRKAELEKMITLSKTLAKEKENMVITAAYIIAGIEGSKEYPGTPKYYELKAKIDSGTATNKEIQEYWTLNNNIMAQAAKLSKTITKFETLRDSTVAQHNGNNTVTVNTNHPFYNNSVEVTNTSAHEVIGHMSDAKKTATTAEERVLQQTTNLPSPDNYNDRIREKSGFYSGAMMEKYQSIINGSKLKK